MTTSAEELVRLIESSDKFSQISAPLHDAFAAYLGLEGPDGNLEAIAAVYRLVSRVKQDIELLPFEQPHKNQLLNYLKPFLPFSSFNGFSQTVEHAKKNLFKPETINNLRNVHFALAGLSKTLVLDDEGHELVAELREISKKVSETELPESVKLALHERFEQAAAVIERFQLFGADAAMEKYEVLMGALALRRQTIEESSPKLWKRMADAALKGVFFVQNADKTVSAGTSLIENGKDALDFLTK